MRYLVVDNAQRSTWNAAQEDSSSREKPMAKDGTRPRLGRGLSSLIVNSAVRGLKSEPQPAPTETPPEGQYLAVPDGTPLTVPVDQITPNPYQPRADFNDVDLEELAASIRQQGVIQPLIVARNDVTGGCPYLLVAGERRLRAARRAGVDEVPVVVRQATRQQMLEWAIIENVQRSDLNPIERAKAYHDYITRFKLTQAKAGEKLGQPRATIANHVRLLDLPDSVQQYVADGRLSFGHAKVLAGLLNEPERLCTLAAKAVADGLSVRQLEELLGPNKPATAKETPSATHKPAYIHDLEQQLTDVVGTRVLIQPGRRKHSGRIVLEYYTLDDFDRIAGSLGLETSE